MKPKFFFLEKIKLTNLWPDSLRKNEIAQMNKIRNEGGELTTNTTNIQKKKKKKPNKLGNL